MAFRALDRESSQKTMAVSATQAFLALDRASTQMILSKAVRTMDDLTLKRAAYTFIASHAPHLLESLVTPEWTKALGDHSTALSLVTTTEALVAATPVLAPAPAPAPVAVPKPVTAAEVVEDSPLHDMRTVSDENIRRLMKLKRIGWEKAWEELRCMELEDGDSICCTEECSDRDEAIEELVEAARRGKKKRNARRAGAGRPVSAEASESED